MVFFLQQQYETITDPMVEIEERGDRIRLQDEEEVREGDKGLGPLWHQAFRTLF